jgi:ketosteroid isomerase-like protein
MLGHREVGMRHPRVVSHAGYILPTMKPADATTTIERVLSDASDPEIAALAAELRSAQLAADVTVLERLIGDDLLFTGPDGRLGTKAQDLEAHASGVVRFRSHEPEELRVRRVGRNVAVAALRARLAVEVAGTITRGTYRYTRVWAREKGGPWRVVGGHVSEVPSQGARDSNESL